MADSGYESELYDLLNNYGRKIIPSDQGDTSAQFNLGMLYVWGKAVSSHEPDFIRAHLWLSLAGEDASAKQQEAMKVLLRWMAEEDIVKAKK